MASRQLLWPFAGPPFSLVNTLFSSVLLAATAVGTVYLVQRLFRSSQSLLGKFEQTKSLVPAASASTSTSTTTSTPSFEPKQHGSQAVVLSQVQEDSSSYANFAQVSTTHASLDLTVDFTKSQLVGHVDYTIVRRNNSEAQELVLDTRDLVVFACLERSSSHGVFKIADFSLDTNTSEQQQQVFGQALRIRLHASTTQVRIKFSTTSKSSALQWLTPQQTTGKRHPFLFSQSQAIHARSFFPCQDTPGVKFTYDAVVRVPAGAGGLVALMSAVSVDDENHPHAFKFKQAVPIPAYLVAIVVGELESRELSPRSRVWSEPSLVEASQREFQLDTERFLTCSEQFLGEYVWGRYDLLVLPTSFPYGGMENPCLVFLTPTLLAGDRSLVNVVAHEIGHCWFGNLVTNASWEDFWLNEGFTVFTERRIIAKLYGAQRAALQTALGIRHWREDAARYMADGQPEFTKLHIEMQGVDPDDSFSSVPYEKGCAFLTHIERLVGGPEVFEQFLRQYVVKFRFGFVDAPTLKQFLLASFPQLERDGLLNWDEWVYAAGMPAGLVEERSVLVDMSEQVAERWTREKRFPEDLVGGAAGWPAAWSCDQFVVFLDRVLELVPELDADVLQEMDQVGQFSLSRNCEIRFKWNSVNLRMPHPTEGSVQDTVQFVGEQGRMKYVRPLYRELFKYNPQLALDTFARHRDFYHSIASKMIARDLGL